uniref:Uncharacterized protein n=1 Tax=Aegilops tauschii subsp. strangulata TaxID=200361 RepID=A0A453MDS2_AEGTS
MTRVGSIGFRIASSPARLMRFRCSNARSKPNFSCSLIYNLAPGLLSCTHSSHC